MKFVDRTISSYIHNEAKEYTFYTIVNRALPSMVDGFKPSQRFVLYSTIKNASKDFKKSAFLCGVISDYGYPHGEASGYDVLAGMATEYANNFPVIKGRGNFGSRQNPAAAEPRYIFGKLDDNFDLLFKDLDLVLPSEIDSYSIPKFYLPVIPFVLINGVHGVATGYATHILPHDIHSVIDECISYVKTGKCKDPEIKFPSFIGNVNTSGEQWTNEGVYELQGKTKLLITEIPVSFNRIKYVAILNNLIEKDQIVSYDEIEGDGDFTFRVTLKRDFDTSHENIMKQFSLSENIYQNINVIGPNSNMVTGDMDLRKYDNTSQLVCEFVDYRMTVVDRRIENMIENLTILIPELKAKAEFIRLARDGKIGYNQPKKSMIQQVKTLLDPELAVYADKVVGLPIFNMTEDEVEKLVKEYEQAEKDLAYWKSTNSKKEYLKDLTTLKNKLKDSK
ncbi:hypothetical protein AP1_0300 [Aeromonas phage AP1]|nr:hypothetical protein AP1_0300 [Aeromonas phage AP1]